MALDLAGQLQMFYNGKLVREAFLADVKLEHCGSPGVPTSRAGRVELRGARLHNTTLAAEKISSCYGDNSPESHCFWTVRDILENSPWLKRRQGWDHFVLFAGRDYPAAYDPHSPPVEEHFVLEKYWPVFGQFMVLHFGARTERCASRYLVPNEGPNNGLLLAQEDPACARRVLRTVTIPPLLPGEPLRCKTTKRRVLGKYRRYRVAYRGLAYGAMIERSLLAKIFETPHFRRVQQMGWVRIELTNWTYELLNSGVCSRRMAFDGLCSWRSLRDPRPATFRGTRTSAMKARARKLWQNAALCLVLPGDGGYERRLYSAIDNGCIPVIVNAVGVSFPKLPFAATLPWSEFAYFWSLDPAAQAVSDYNSGKEGMMLSFVQLFQQLLAISEASLIQKQRALLKYMPGLSWYPQRQCEMGTLSHQHLHNGMSALALTVRELAVLSALPQDLTEAPAEAWRRKDAMHHVAYTHEKEDATGNGCPFGYFGCYNTPDDQPHLGHYCVTNLAGTGYACPISCQPETDGNSAKRCVNRDDPSMPCRSPRCNYPVSFVDVANPTPVEVPGLETQRPADEPVYAIVSFSDRDDLTELTWPTLQRFVESHPERYDLFLTGETLVDGRDFHPSWNKLAHVRRLLLTGHPVLQSKYDAVVWIDDDVAITNYTHDPLFDAIQENLPPYDKLTVQVVASRDTLVWERVPLNSGVLIFRRSSEALTIIEALFRLSRQQHLFGGVWRTPRLEGFWDQDAFAAYIREHGDAAFHFVEHGVLQSFVRFSESKWRAGDFAAHFTFLAEAGGRVEQLNFVRGALQQMLATSITGEVASVSSPS